MALKRKSYNEGDDSRNLKIPVQQSKRRHGDSEQMAIRIGSRLVVLSIGDIVSGVTDLVRRLIQEEVEPRLLSSITDRVGTSGTKPMKLRFANEVSSTIFTRSKIKSEENKFIQIELIDARSQSIITEDPLSSIEIEIYVLDAEFGSKGEEDWTADQFGAHILPPRDGRKSLLEGKARIRLQNGVGTITNLMFTDNSSWRRTKMFRLGAKVAKSSPSKENIREGISEPIRVKDIRGKDGMKHDLPSLNDEIFRLKNLAKTSKVYHQLCLDGIKTVKDLLRLYITNPSSLQEKFSTIPKKQWEAIIEHAKKCKIDKNDDYKLYSCPSTGIRLLFNPIYKLEGVALNGQNYCRPHTLTAAEDKVKFETAKEHAYKNLQHLLSINEQTTTSLLSQLDVSPHPHQILEQINCYGSHFSDVNQGQPENLAGSTQHLCEAVHDPMVQSSDGWRVQLSPFTTAFFDRHLTVSQSEDIPPHDSSTTSYLPPSTTLLGCIPEQDFDASYDPQPHEMHEMP